MYVREGRRVCEDDVVGRRRCGSREEGWQGQARAAGARQRDSPSVWAVEGRSTTSMQAIECRAHRKWSIMDIVWEPR